MKVWSVRAYFAMARPTTMSATTASAGSCRRCRRPGGGHGDQGGQHGAGDRAAEVRLPGDARDDEAEDGVDGEDGDDAGRGPAEVPVQHEQGGEEAEHRPRGTDGADDPRAALAQVVDAAGRGGQQQVADRAAEGADEVERGEAQPAEHRLEVAADLVEREHVEQDVQRWPCACANAAVRNRHGSLTPWYGANDSSWVTVGETCCSSQTAVQMPMIVSVTTGRPSRDRGRRTACAARARSAGRSRTQSTHWTPTAAGRWHSGQVGRPQRWQRT